LFVAVVMIASVLVFTTSAPGHADEEAAPIYGVKVPPGYRDWKLISIARVGAPLNDLRAKLGNDVAMKAYRDGRLPFPDGTIIARIAWKQVTSEENNNAIRLRSGTETHLTPEQVEKLLSESFVAGPPTNVQFMVKDSTGRKWPERETVTDASQGVQVATIQQLARYWGTDYDWRKVEARLNALPQFVTEIDGLDIHFIHVRSKHENALPLIVTHGWPGSIIEPGQRQAQN
jgi:hypothetical protein